MSLYRVLIVEDDPFVALDLEEIVSRTLASEVIISATLGGAERAARHHLDFAFLDVDVLDGKTYDLATDLSDRDVPFAFVTASNPKAVPRPLRHAPFVAKPFTVRTIEALLSVAGQGPGLGHA